MNELVGQVKSVWEKATDHISHYLDLKEGIKDSELVQIAGDSIKILGVVKKTTSMIMQKRFEMFLRGFNPSQVPTEEQMNKLLDYIDDEAKAEFIADTFSKVMLSQSSIASLLMGTLLNSMIENKKSLSHNDLICVHALSNLFNDDIKNYKFIYEYINRDRAAKPRTKVSSLLEGRAFEQHLAINLMPAESVRLTIEKAVAYQLVSRYNEIDLSIDDDDPSSGSSAEVDEYYRITSPGEQLYKYIINCGLFN